MKNHHSVLIAAHSHLGFEGIASLIESNPAYRILQYEEREEDLFKTLQRTRPDVVIMCYRFSGDGANATILEIKKSLPDIPILIVSAQPRNFETVTGLYNAGACGFICSTTADKHALFNALEQATKGDNYYTNSYKDQLIEQTVVSESASSDDNRASQSTLTPSLSVRERQVLDQIARGKSAKEIARILNISKNTVEVHRRNIMVKLGLRKSTELARYAFERGLVDL